MGTQEMKVGSDGKSCHRSQARCPRAHGGWRAPRQQSRGISLVADALSKDSSRHGPTFHTRDAPLYWGRTLDPQTKV
jgi:hypothetical protein